MKITSVIFRVEGKEIEIDTTKPCAELVSLAEKLKEYCTDGDYDITNKGANRTFLLESGEAKIEVELFRVSGNVDPTMPDYTRPDYGYMNIFLNGSDISPYKEMLFVRTDECDSYVDICEFAERCKKTLEGEFELRTDDDYPKEYDKSTKYEIFDNKYFEQGFTVSEWARERDNGEVHYDTILYFCYDDKGVGDPLW